MAWTLVNHSVVGFADGNTGHVYTLPSGAPSVGDLDIITINSDTVVTMPSGFSSAASFVNSQGSYLWYRFATGGEASTVTITTSGNFDTALTWSRWQGGSAFDVGVNAHVDGSSDTTTPAVSTGTLAGAGELVVAFAALHSGGSPTNPVWSSGYTALDSMTQNAVTGFTAYRTNAGAAAETPNVAWTTGMSDRYILVGAFTPAAGGATIQAAASLAASGGLAATAVNRVMAAATLVGSATLSATFGHVTVARPNTGLVTRPFTGTVARP